MLCFLKCFFYYLFSSLILSFSLKIKISVTLMSNLNTFSGGYIFECVYNSLPDLAVKPCVSALYWVERVILCVPPLLKMKGKGWNGLPVLATVSSLKQLWCCNNTNVPKKQNDMKTQIIQTLFFILSRVVISLNLNNISGLCHMYALYYKWQA